MKKSVFFLLFLLAACAPTKLQRVQREHLAARLSLSREELRQELSLASATPGDSAQMTEVGGVQYYRMKAVKDSLSGEVMAGQLLDAAVVTARFRNVAERHGRVDLRFEVEVPEQMQDSRWQLRFYPDLYVMEDSLRLDPIIITGSEYRAGQLRGYELYKRYLGRIITDSTRFVDCRNLDIFLRRNQEAAMEEALDHYTHHLLQRLNDRRIAGKGRMYRRYVKVPIDTEGVRLDTVMQTVNGDFVYQYRQSIETRPGLRRADVVLQGDIWDGDKRVYSMERTQPLTFYISSLSTMVDERPRFLSRIVSRIATSNACFRLSFRPGRWAIDPGLDDNRAELDRIQRHIDALLGDGELALDSILVSASASPEGREQQNNALCLKRAAAVAGHFRSLTGQRPCTRSRSLGENWPSLSEMVDTSTFLSEEQKTRFTRVMAIRNLDERERALKRMPCYPYLRDSLFPLLRTVRFDFFMHRRGMLQDTVLTTERDTLYDRGVTLLKEREYRAALGILRPYRDYNTALALVSLDYNATAMDILQKVEPTPAVNYLLALLYARCADERKAVAHYLEACREDRSYVFRGNLDPEIHILMKRHGLYQE